MAGVAADDGAESIPNPAAATAHRNATSVNE